VQYSYGYPTHPPVWPSNLRTQAVSVYLIRYCPGDPSNVGRITLPHSSILMFDPCSDGTQVLFSQLELPHLLGKLRAGNY